MRRYLNKYLATLFIAVMSFGNPAIASTVDSTSVPNSSVTEAASFSGSLGEGLPIGSIVMWPSNTIPAGWVRMTGQTGINTTYPLLSKVIGTWIPDMRGYFPRGTGGTNSTVKAAQSDAIRNLTGTISYVAESYNDEAVVSGVFTKQVGYKAANTPKTTDSSYSGRLTFDASNVVPTSNENRPLNRAFNFIIKYQ